MKKQLLVLVVATMIFGVAMPANVEAANSANSNVMQIVTHQIKSPHYEKKPEGKPKPGHHMKPQPRGDHRVPPGHGGKHRVPPPPPVKWYYHPFVYTIGYNHGYAAGYYGWSYGANYGYHGAAYEKGAYDAGYKLGYHRGRKDRYN